MPSSWKRLGRSRKESPPASSLTPSGSNSAISGSQLSVPETLPPGYEEGDAQTMSDHKPLSSCPKCGWSAHSENLDPSAQTLGIQVSPPTKNLDHSARDLPLVVWSPTEIPSEALSKVSAYMEKIGELIPELGIASRQKESDNRVWEIASREDLSGSRCTTKAWGQRTISNAEHEIKSIVLAATLAWVAEGGKELKDVQGLMAEKRVDLATQREVNNMWRKMEVEKKKKTEIIS